MTSQRLEVRDDDVNMGMTVKVLDELERRSSTILGKRWGHFRADTVLLLTSVLAVTVTVTVTAVKLTMSTALHLMEAVTLSSHSHYEGSSECFG